MNRALWFLLLAQKRGAALQFARGLGQPKRLIGVLLLAAVFALVVFGQRLGAERDGSYTAGAATAVGGFLGVMLVLSLFAGILQRGPAFLPADIDWLFPAPFQRAELVLYRILSLYPMTALSSLFLLLFFAPRFESPWLGCLGVVLCQWINVNLQTAASLFAAAFRIDVYRKLHKLAQVLAWLILLGGLGAGIAAIAAEDGAGARVRAFFSSEHLKWVYPAWAAGRLSVASDLAEGWRDLLGLAAALFASLALALGLHVRFFEASLDASARLARTMSQARRGVVGRSLGASDRARRVDLPRLPLFTGAGAIFWRNLTCVARTLPALLVSLLVTALLVAVTLGMASRAVGGDGGESAAHSTALTIVLLLPVLVERHLAYDFRRDGESIAELKLLPVAPFLVALAEVATPICLAVLLQYVLLAAVAISFQVPMSWVALAALAAPLIACSALAIQNLAFLLYPTRSGGAGGRANAGSMAVSATLTALGCFVALLPALGAGAVVLWATASIAAAAAATLAVQVAVDAALLYAVGRAFVAFDVSRDRA